MVDCSGGAAQTSGHVLQLVRQIRAGCDRRQRFPVGVIEGYGLFHNLAKPRKHLTLICAKVYEAVQPMSTRPVTASLTARIRAARARTTASATATRAAPATRGFCHGLLATPARRPAPRRVRQAE